MPAPTARHPVGFLSYVHADDEADEGRLTQFRIRLEREIRVQTGTELTIFQDRQDIRWGQEWRRRIESSIDGIAFLIPILTPSFFLSQQCRQEFERFLQHERELHRNDLIFPVYYVSCRALDESDNQDDNIARVLSGRQYTDWRDLRFEALTSPKAARRIAELAQHLGAALLRNDSHPGAPAGRLAAEPPRMAGAAGAIFSSADGTDIGLVKVFPAFDDCQAEILTQVRESHAISIFVQMGKSVLSGAAIIYEALEHSRSDAEVKILHAGFQNPYLSERVALKRSSDYGEWREDISYATGVGDRLQRSLGARFELRRHSEGYVWRFFLFDDYVYMQPYLYPQDNSHKAPVLKFDRRDAVDPEAENVRSLYHMFRTYFDLKWEEYAPEARRLDDLIGPDDPAAVAAPLVERGGLRVFVVPKRFVAQNGEELPFHSIGGKRNPLEDWGDALRREALEEIGTELQVKSSRRTRDITTSAEFEPMMLSDSPRPYCVYKRTRALDPEVVEEEVLWIVGYEADLPADAAIEPRAEIAAIVLLSPNMLRRTARERITYEQIRHARDGSGVLLQAGVDLDFERVAVPVGLAALPTFSA